LRLADALPEYRMPLGHCAEALGLLDEARAAYVSVRDDRLASPVERGLGRIALEALSPLLKEPR
jgi:hypothetical protein